jgi:mannose-1-phosphate guanylyltransferase/mannose-6-phosphate isomerase
MNISISTSSSVINVIPGILCDVSGTGLWPLSRSGFPKQFLVLSGKASLFQKAVGRVNAIASDDISVGEILVVSGEYQYWVQKQYS